MNDIPALGSGAIMAHPLRTHFVALLRARLPGAEVVMDRNHDRWDTGRRSMLVGVRSGSEQWHLVIQDDALLCRDFVTQAERALRSVPRIEPVVSFYLSKTATFADAVTQATKSDCSWIAAPGPLWGVGVAVRQGCIAEMIAECDTYHDEPQYDLRMARFWESRNIHCLYSVPSLVDHRVGILNPSLIKGRSSSKRRTAEWFLGAERHAPIWNSRVLPSFKSLV